MIRKTISLWMILLISVSFYAQTTIFSSGSEWKYLDDGSNQGTAWKETGFDDSSWSSGNAEFGYGDNDETTVVSFGPNSGNKYPTTYFRKTFTATAMDAGLPNMLLEAIRDDGMVVYLNGNQVWSDNMPAVFNYQTYASTALGGSSESTWISKNGTNALVEGTNVLAVEIHNGGASSSDLSFDFRLSLTSLVDELITANSTWKYLDDGSDQGTTWKDTGFNDTSWSTGTAKFGYGGDGETTTVQYGPDASNKYRTTYFRKEFTVVDHTQYGSIELSALRDDGMIVYLNGTKIWSDNMPATVDYQTLANIGLGSFQETLWINKTIGNNLVTGTNVVAVEIHNASTSSSDLGFDLTLTAKAPLPAEVKRGPYHQKGSPNKATIKWRTNVPTPTIVNYGTSLGALNATVSDMTAKVDHEIELTNLSPNTMYYYELANTDEIYLEENSEMYIKTPPTAGTRQFVRTWILGDPGTANQNQKNVRDQYTSYIAGAASNPNQTDIMLFLGDNAYQSGLDNEYQAALFDIYPETLRKSFTWSTLGNHDAYVASTTHQSGPYYDIFTFPTAAEVGGIASGTEAYYSFDYANIHFIVLESNSLSSDATQIAWCTQDIQSTTQDWIVALFHHPPYTKGSHDSDVEGALIRMRENFLPILEENGVDLVLSGHSHSYERSYFLKDHYQNSSTFNTATHTVGTNGALSGKADTADGAYNKTSTDTDGAVYITTGSAGKISGGDLNHNAMYASLNQLGSCVLEVENDGSNGQNLTIKFINDNGTISDYFTIHKTLSTLSNDSFDYKQSVAFPIPANNYLNIDLKGNVKIKEVNIYNTIGELVKSINDSNRINVYSLTPGVYTARIITENGVESFKNFIKK